MKDQLRVLGVDDAPFNFRQGTVPIVGALVRSPGYLEAVMVSAVTIDGQDANDGLTKMISSSRYREQISLVLIDGVALGGFNVVDIKRMHQETGISCATVTRDAPDLERIRKALQAHFDDWERRWEIITAQPLQVVQTRHRPLHVSSYGISSNELVELLQQTTVQGALPEPLRLAHLIATALIKGESSGRA